MRKPAHLTHWSRYKADMRLCEDILHIRNS